MIFVAWPMERTVFESRILGVAHGLRVLDPTDGVAMIEGILANLETTRNDVGREPWCAKKLEGLRFPAAELCGSCVKLENRVTELDLANYESFWYWCSPFGVRRGACKRFCVPCSRTSNCS